MVLHKTYSSGFLSFTNGSHKGFVEFCVIEVFKFWIILRWMKGGCKSLSLGMPWHSNLLSKNEQPTKLGDAPEWHPRFRPTTIGILLETIFFICHMICVLLGASCMICVFACFIFCFKSSILGGQTYLREPKLFHDLIELLYMLHLNFYELWTCSSPLPISFLTRCAQYFWRNALLLHLDLFES